MPNRIAVTKLNARTIDIINVIRQNASANYQSLVPMITKEEEIPHVGEVILGYPALANEFVSCLVNRIALVVTRSATFNNPYKDLKKGYLEFGETIEEVFVNLAKAVEFSAEKAETREHRRTLPDVRAAFHVINWKVVYPITVQYQDLKQAFTSAEGVRGMTMKVIDSVYRAAEYDEYLLFKYLIIKSVAHGKMHPVAIDLTTDGLKGAAKAFRATSNKLPFLATTYNEAGVHTNTAKNDQYIFMDADFSAEYDVGVLADAFNMDKADIKGHLKMIDSFTEFDNERFAEIREESDGLEEITDEELALMADVKAVLVDKEWFQIYDNLEVFDEAKVASGLYYNYFYHVWKTVSYSPFSNAVAFIDDTAEALPDDITLEVTAKDVSALGTVFTLEAEFDDAQFDRTQVEFLQDSATGAVGAQRGSAISAGIAVHKYGAIILPAGDLNGIKITVKYRGVEYTATAALTSAADVGDELTLEPPDTTA